MIKKILVTGGMGYIGSHTVVELIQAGYKVLIVDNLSNSEKRALKGIETITDVKPDFVKVDCCNAAKLNRVFDAFKPHAVIHFAASKAVGESVHEPLKYYSNNIMSLVNVLDAMRSHRVKNIVFSSSCTVYGQAEQLPVTEQTPRREATSPYGNTKHICEDIIRDSVAAYKGLNAIALRYFNPIGAHPSALIGELPNGVPNNLVPFITQTAAGIRTRMQVFGNDYNTPDGTCIRDYINVVDLAKAHIKALDRMLFGTMKSQYEIFNIGTGKGVSTLDVVKTFEQVNNVKLNYKIAGRREGDIEAVWADPSYANKELGWKAEATLEETLQSAWQWQRTLCKDL